MTDTITTQGNLIDINVDGSTIKTRISNGGTPGELVFSDYNTTGPVDTPLLTLNKEIIDCHGSILENVGNPTIDTDGVNRAYSDRLQKLFVNFNNGALDGDTKRIVCFGDSITFGFDPDNGGAQIGTPYPARLQEYLRLMYQNNNITVVNQGISGNTTASLIARFDTAVVDETPDFVIQMIGINDCGLSVDPDTFRSNLIILYNNYLTNDIPVVYATTTPVKRSDNGVSGSYIHYRLGIYNKITEDVCLQYKIPMINVYQDFNKIFQLSSDYTVQNFLPVDDYHPTQPGYDLIAGVMFKSIVPTLCIEEESAEYGYVGSQFTFDVGYPTVFEDAQNNFGRNYILYQGGTKKVVIPVFLYSNDYYITTSIPQTSGAANGYRFRVNGALSTTTLDFNNGGGSNIFNVIQEIDKSDIVLGLTIVDFDEQDVASSFIFPNSFLFQKTLNQPLVGYLRENKDSTTTRYYDIKNTGTDFFQETFFRDDTITNRINYMQWKTIGINTELNFSFLDKRVYANATGLWALGSSTNRWRNIFLTEAVDVSSDQRLKEDIRENLTDNEIKAGLEIAKAIRLYSLKSDESKKTQVGVYAQEVIRILDNNGINWKEYAFINEGEDGYYSIVYDQLNAFCIKAMSEKLLSI